MYKLESTFNLYLHKHVTIEISNQPNCIIECWDYEYMMRESIFHSHLHFYGHTHCAHIQGLNNI